MEKVFNHNPNQSSVDWVIGEILKHQMTFYGHSSIPLRIIEKGKKMHKKEVTDAYIQSGASIEDIIKEAANEYYKEKFNTK